MSEKISIANVLSCYFTINNTTIGTKIWIDAFGIEHSVTPALLEVVEAALTYKVESRAGNRRQVEARKALFDTLEKFTR